MNAQQIKFTGKWISLIAMILNLIALGIVSIPSNIIALDPEMFKVILAFGAFCGALGSYLAHKDQAVA